MNITDVTGDFGSICICAIRYCLDRQTYMPRLVQEFIMQNIDNLSTDDLAIIKRDIFEALHMGNYGNERIDKPGWEQFFDNITIGILERG